MVRQVNLLAAIVGFVLIVGALLVFRGVPAFAATSCNALRQVAGLCHSASSNGSGVAVEARRTSSTAPTTFRAHPRTSSRVLNAAQIQALWDEQCYGSGHCSTGSSNGLNNLLLPRDPGEPADAAAPARIVTIEDVERFLPSTAQLHAEPDGWAVIGVPANFWTVVRPIVVDGELLGEAAEVRFAPQLYRWDYGDGGSRTTRSGGASWSGLAQQELTETASSHVYLQKADVKASVTVVWSAEYRIGAGAWIAVAGAVSSTAPAVDLLVVKERTVLTAR